MNRLGQFVHGLCLPFHLVRTMLEDRRLRRRYLAVSLLQVIAILGLAVLFTGSGKEVVETVGPEQWTEQPGAAQRQVAEEHPRVAGEAAKPAVTKAGRPVKKRTVHRTVYLAALLSSLQLAQWIIIALSRDFHTVLEREVSLRTGVVPEDEPITPRVRLDVPWLRTKMKRRWRALVVFALGVPVLWVFTVFLPWDDRLFTVLTSLWGAWWFVVFTAGKSALAWKEQAPREPWFLRGWSGLTSRIAPLRWALLGVYGSVWTNQTREVFSPAASVERRPWGLLGLSVVRALAVLPLVKCFLRPVIPVAAAHLLADGQSGRESVPGGG